MSYSIGIDIGSTSAKCVVVKDGERLAFKCVIPTGYNSVEASNRLRSLLAEAGFPIDDADAIIATGYGRVSVPFATDTITEITCHGKGAGYLFGEDLTVIDIGGQDTKAVKLVNGRVLKFLMNDKCSAGTGKFLEVMANRLGLEMHELTTLAALGKPTPISSMCTVFAESEVIALIGKGCAREDIARGVIDSVINKVVSLVSKIGGEKYALTGGLCDEDYIVESLSEALSAPVITNKDARFAGAIGAALSA